jgi:hypothetical protein
MNWEVIASIATAIGVFIAAWQIWESRKLTEATFEDSFDQQYRELIYTIPVNALLGKPLDDGKEDQARETVYNYLDLCNEQIYQRAKDRISKERWNEWSSGIKENLSRPFFLSVWDEVKESASDSFSFLERLENEKFKTDPITWKKV